MKEEGRLGIKGIEGEDDVYPKVSQLSAEVRIFCQTETVGVHGDPADLRPLATAQKIEDVRMERWLASGDIDEIDSIRGFDDPVNRPLHFLHGHMIDPIGTIVGKADWATEVAGVRHRNHRKLAGTRMPCTRPAIVRTSVLQRIGLFKGRPVRRGPQDIFQVPILVRCNQCRPASAAVTEILLPDLSLPEEDPGGDDRSA
jgi:hypothetical protein